MNFGYVDTFLTNDGNVRSDVRVSGSVDPYDDWNVSDVRITVLEKSDCTPDEEIVAEIMSKYHDELITNLANEASDILNGA
jgi:hypothetical protein